MKKHLISLLIFFCFSLSLAKAYINPTVNTYEDKPMKQVSLHQLLTLSPKQFQKATGTKLTFGQKIVYRLLQKKLKKQLRYQNPETPLSKADKTANFSLGAGIMTWLCALIGLLFPPISVFAIPFSIVALITGAVAHKKTTKKTNSIVGMVLGGLYLLLLGIAIIALSKTF